MRAATVKHGSSYHRAVSTASATVRLALAVAIVALVAAGAALGFRELLHVVYLHVLGDRDVSRGAAALPWWLCLLMPAVGGAVAAGLAQLGRSGNAGVGGVMEAVLLGRGRISLRASAVRVVACFIAVASAGSIGREGPIIQLGAGVGDALGRRVRMVDFQRRMLIAAGTAAGFAAAYGTPLAGVLFVVEVVTISAATRMVVPVAIAAVVAGLVVRSGPLYGARAFVWGERVELLAFAGLGVVAAVAGVAFMTLLRLAARGFARIPGPVALRAGLGGAIAGAIMIGAPGVAGNGYEAIRGLLDVDTLASAVAVLLVAKVFATAASVGSGTPGGVFTPALLVGASMGRLVALGLAAAGAHVDPGAYAVVGMAAACAATTHAPLMASVMLLELTDDSSLIAPLLLASIVATVTARLVHPDSLYTEELRRRNVPWGRVSAPPEPPPRVEVEGGEGI